MSPSKIVVPGDLGPVQMNRLQQSMDKSIGRLMNKADPRALSLPPSLKRKKTSMGYNSFGRNQPTIMMDDIEEVTRGNNP